MADWLNRTDLTAIIPTFIALAEAEMNRAIRTRDMIARATATVSAEYVPLPTDYQEMRDVRVSYQARYYRMKVLSPNELDDYEWASGNTSGNPQYYAIVGSSLRMLPAPAAEYTVEMSYFGKIPALSNSATTNWMLTKNPDFYLYAALAHSAPYLKDDERAGMWANMASAMAGSIMGEDEKALYSGSTPTMRALGIS